MTIDIDAIEARAKAATEGPWRASSGRGCRKIGPKRDRNRQTRITGIAGTYGLSDDKQDKANAAFIASARTDVPDLCAEVRALRARVAQAESERDSLIKQVELVSQRLDGARQVIQGMRFGVGYEDGEQQHDDLDFSEGFHVVERSPQAKVASEVAAERDALRADVQRITAERDDARRIGAGLLHLKGEVDELHARITSGRASHNEDRVRADTLWRERDALRAQIDAAREALAGVDVATMTTRRLRESIERARKALEDGR